MIFHRIYTKMCLPHLFPAVGFHRNSNHSKPPSLHLGGGVEHSRSCFLYSSHFISLRSPGKKKCKRITLCLGALWTEALRVKLANKLLTRCRWIATGHGLSKSTSFHSGRWSSLNRIVSVPRLCWCLMFRHIARRGEPFRH